MARAGKAELDRVFLISKLEEEAGWYPRHSIFVSAQFIAPPGKEVLVVFRCRAAGACLDKVVHAHRAAKMRWDKRNSSRLTPSIAEDAPARFPGGLLDLSIVVREANRAAAKASVGVHDERVVSWKPGGRGDDKLRVVIKDEVLDRAWNSGGRHGGQPATSSGQRSWIRVSRVDTPRTDSTWPTVGPD